MTTIIVVLSIVTYLVSGGIFGMRFYKWRVYQCRSCNNRGYGFGCTNDHGFAAGLASVVWPAVTIVIAGMLIADLPRLRKEAEIRKLQEQQAIERQRHDIEMEKLRHEDEEAIMVQRRLNHLGIDT